MDVPSFSMASLGGGSLSLPETLGFVACTADPSVSETCLFNVEPEPLSPPEHLGFKLVSLFARRGTRRTPAVADQESASLRASQEPILSPDGVFLLLPGNADCTEPSDDQVFLGPSSPLEDEQIDAALRPFLVLTNLVAHEAYLQGALSGDDKAWLHAQGWATLCWVWKPESDAASVRRVLSNVVWVGPAPDAAPLEVVCDLPGGCDVGVQVKNLDLLDNSFSRLAVLDACGRPEGVGVATLKTKPSEQQPSSGIDADSDSAQSAVQLLGSADLEPRTSFKKQRSLPSLSLPHL